jgi:hypothetical protein
MKKGKSKTPKTIRGGLRPRALADATAAFYEVVEKIALWLGFAFGLIALIIASVVFHRFTKHTEGVDVSPVRQHNKEFFIPKKSKQISDHVFELKKNENANITGLFIVHYEGEQSKVTVRKSKMEGYEIAISGQCYAAYARGARWKNKERFLIAYANNQGLSTNFIQSTFNTAVREWNSADSQGVIFGSLDTQNVAEGFDMENPDGRNEVHFAYLSEPGVLAVTIVWGIFSGPEGDREIFEWDQIYNENYRWGDVTQNSNLNDLQNTVTHELGHASGLRDIYDSSCSHVTMYGYAATGETKKRTLASEDIRGINALYSGQGGSSFDTNTHGSHKNPSQGVGGVNSGNELKISTVLISFIVIFLL